MADTAQTNPFRSFQTPIPSRSVGIGSCSKPYCSQTSVARNSRSEWAAKAEKTQAKEIWHQKGSEDIQPELTGSSSLLAASEPFTPKWSRGTALGRPEEKALSHGSTMSHSQRYKTGQPSARRVNDTTFYDERTEIGIINRRVSEQNSTKDVRSVLYSHGRQRYFGSLPQIESEAEQLPDVSLEGRNERGLLPPKGAFQFYTNQHDKDNRSHISLHPLQSSYGRNGGTIMGELGVEIAPRSALLTQENRNQPNLSSEDQLYNRDHNGTMDNILTSPKDYPNARSGYHARVDNGGYDDPSVKFSTRTAPRSFECGSRAGADVNQGVHAKTPYHCASGLPSADFGLPPGQDISFSVANREGPSASKSVWNTQAPFNCPNHLDPAFRSNTSDWYRIQELRAYQAWKEQMLYLSQYALRGHTAAGFEYGHEIRHDLGYSARPPFFSSVHIPNAPRLQMHSSSGMRRLPLAEIPTDHAKVTRSAFLEEFRATHRNPTRSWQLRHIYGHVVEFCGDHHGSKFIQNMLEKARPEEKDRIFRELQADALPLMKDIFGNYVIQNYFEHGDALHKKILLNQMRGQVAGLSKHTYGCRVVQEAINHILVDQQAALISELDSPQLVMDCVKNENGNHVIQVAVRVIPIQHIQFMVEIFHGQLEFLATHRYGCRVVQRLLEKVEAPEMVTRIMYGLHACQSQLIADQFGNYVPQHIMETGSPEDRAKIVDVVLLDVFAYSSQKFASNVVEKCVKHGTDHQRCQIMLQLAADDRCGEDRLFLLIQDSYGNYVIQSLLDHLNDADYREFRMVLEPQVTKALRMMPLTKTAENVARKMHRLPAPRLDTRATGWNEDAFAPRQLALRYGHVHFDPLLINTSLPMQSSIPTPPSTIAAADSPQSSMFFPPATSQPPNRHGSNETHKFGGVTMHKS